MLEVGDTARWVKHLHTKCEDLSSIPRTHIKPGIAGHVCNPSAPKVSWEVEIEESLESWGPACQEYTAVNKSPILKVEEKMTSQVITTSIQALLQVCIYIHRKRVRN